MNKNLGRAAWEPSKHGQTPAHGQVRKNNGMFEDRKEVPGPEWWEWEPKGWEGPAEQQDEAGEMCRGQIP